MREETITEPDICAAKEQTIDHATGFVDLALLYRTHRWFELRDAVEGESRLAFYRAAVACAFNAPGCDEILAGVIRSAPQAEESYQAHDLLIWMHMRRGNFPSALPHLDSMQALKPNHSALQDTRALFSALGERGQEMVSQLHPCSLTYAMVEGNMFIPVAVNDKPAQFMIDSGATISMITRSEARRLGLTIQNAGSAAVKLYGATGAQVGFQIAIAARLSIGSLHLANVAFLVLQDNQLNFPTGYCGTLGLPVLLVLKTIRWWKNGTFEFGFPSCEGDLRRANICFDGAEPMTQVDCAGRQITMTLDTGNGRTIFGPVFARKFPELIGNSAQRTSIQVNGVSGSALFEAIDLPFAKLRVGGLDTVLRSAYVLLQETTPNSGWLCGRLGMDTLNQATRVSIDFNNMNLILE
jgi:clan AA aspartic protease (TIGR02281 family)